MRVSLWLLFIFLYGLSFSQNSSPHENSKDTNAQNGENAQQPEQQPPIAARINRPPSQQIGSDKKAQDEYSPENRAYRVHILDEPTSRWTIAYVFITAAIGAVGLLSIWILWRQTSIAQVSAQAALLSAQAVINAERAWVMVDVRFVPPFHLAKLSSSDGSVHTRAKMEVSIKNCGPTPAWVVEQYICLRVADFVVMSKEEYLTPKFPHFAEDGPYAGHGRVSSANYSILPLVQGQEPVKWEADLSDPGWATEDNGLYVHIFGVVRYRDAFSRSRETYFGYSVWKGELERMPSEAYNKNT
jgi:hypothetical protein